MTELARVCVLPRTRGARECDLSICNRKRCVLSLSRPEGVCTSVFSHRLGVSKAKEGGLILPLVVQANAAAFREGLEQCARVSVVKG